MAINGETKTAVDTLLTSDTTTELNFKTGLEHVTTELDSGVVKTDSQFGGNVSGTYDNITVDPASHDHGATNYTETEIDAFFAGNTVITGYNNTNWDTAYGWGNHGSEGYLTAVAFSDINAAAVQLSSESFSDDDTSLMTSAAIADYVAGEIPSNVPTTTKQTEWDTAYNAAVAGTSSVNIDSGTIDGVTIGTTSAVTDLRVDNIKIDGNVISSTNTNGDISLTPAGTGEVNISKVDIGGGAIDGVTIGTNSAVTDLRVDNLKVDGSTISATNTDGGVTISPTSGGSGNITVGPFAQANSLVVESSNADTFPAKLTLYKNSASPANGDTVGQIEFRGKDSVASDYNYASIRATSDSITNGSERGLLKFTLFEANVGSDVLTIQKTKINSYINFEFSNGNGIDFSSTAGSGATSGLFDDYEEGTWTPVFNADTGSFATANISITSAIYTKVGRLVTLMASIYTGDISVGTASGSLQIAGLPYTPTTDRFGSSVFGSLIAGETPTMISVDNTGAGYLLLYYYSTLTAGPSIFEVSDLTTGGGTANVLRFTITYEV